jgi:hypothetical protein
MWPEAGESHNGKETEETGKPVAAQSMNLEASEQEGPKMQPQSETESLEAPCRVAVVSPCWKAEEAGVWGPQGRAAVVDALTQKSAAYVPCTSCQSSLETPSQTHSEVCSTNLGIS